MIWLQNFLDNTIVQAFLAIIAVVGFGWGFYSHSFSNKKQRISTAFSSFEIIKQGKNTIQQLSLSFAGKEIHDLTITKFAIWNSGNKVINGADIVQSQKLRVISDGSSEILEAQIVTESDEANSFRICDVSNNQVCLDFDYIDSREGIVLQVLHTGSVNALNVDCKIKGGKPIKRLDAETNNTKRSPRIRRAMRKIMAVLVAIEALLILLLAAMITLVTTGILPKTVLSSPVIIPNNKPLSTTMLWLSVAMVLYVTAKIVRNAFSIGVPHKLKSFGNSFDNV